MTDAAKPRKTIIGVPPNLVEAPDAAPVAGRFVLLSYANGVQPEYVTSWDTWEEAEAAFPIGWMCFLRDDETGHQVAAWRTVRVGRSAIDRYGG